MTTRVDRVNDRCDRDAKATQGLDEQLVALWTKWVEVVLTPMSDVFSNLYALDPPAICSCDLRVHRGWCDRPNTYTFYSFGYSRTITE